MTMKQDTQPVAMTLTVTGESEPVGADVDATELPVRDSSRYERVAEHARGGLGQIWRARDRELGRTVALKELLRPSAEGEARFVREALITARLEHPSIVAVHDAGRSTAGQPFYTMKLIAGESLRDRIGECHSARDRLSLLPHVIAVADAVAYAHDHGVVHRDLKPANVLVGDYGETVVVDWGLAKQLGAADMPGDVRDGPYREPGDGELTCAGAVLGTPAYMAPEQARGEPVDERADVYAIGAVLHHVLAGDKPYAGSDPQQVLDAVLDSSPADLAVAAPFAPKDLVAIARRAMARERDQRYRTAKHLADDLRRFQTGQLVSVHDYSLRQIIARWIRRHRTAVAVAVLGILAIAAVGVASVQRIVEARAVADARLTDSLVDRGRRSLLAGDFRDASLYLSGAYLRGADGADVRLMLPLATRAFEAQVAALDHDSRVWEVNYSPDGRFLLVTAESGAHLWDSVSRAHHAALDGHGSSQTRVARFSADGAFVVTGGDDATARVWRTSDGQAIAVLEGHDGSVRDVAVSPDSQLIATATPRGTVRIYSVSGQLVDQFAAHSGWIWRVVFSPTGSVLATAGGDGAVKLWDPNTGSPTHDLAGHQRGTRNIAFDRTGDRLVSVGMDGTGTVWRVGDGAIVASFAGQNRSVVGASFSPDGKRVLTSGLDTAMQLWDADTGQLVRFFRGHKGAVYWSAFSPDGASVVSTSWDGTARVWDADTGTASLTMAGHAGPVVWGALSPDGAVLATSSWDGSVRFWDTTRRNQRASVRTPNSPIDTVRLDPAAGRALACAPNGVTVVDVRSGELLVRIPVAQSLAECAFDPTGARIATVEHGGAVRLWSAADGTMLEELQASGGAPIEAVAFDDAGTQLAVVGVGGTGIVWHLDTATETRFSPHEHGTTVDFSSDGRRLLTGGADQRAKVWRLGDGQPVLELDIEVHDYLVMQGRFSPDDTHFATASYDGSAKVWDATTGRLMADLSAHTGEVYSVAFHPSGELVVTASTDVATVWDVATGRAVARMSGHAGRVMDAVFSPDGQVLLTAGDEGVVKLWETSGETRSPEEVADTVACLLGETSAAACDRVAARPPQP